MVLDAQHEAFTAWAQQQGVVIQGVLAVKLSGKGFGVVATRNLVKGESIVAIPASALITHDSDFVRISGFARSTVYGTVAAAFTVNHDTEERWYKPWQYTWPSRADMEATMPLCWNLEEQMLLTPTARVLLKHQREKYDADYALAKAKIPGHLQDWYKYYWLVVNTRCFYWTYFKKARDAARRGKKLARDECLALVPWGDYFNHEDHGCQVVENAKGVAIICDRSYSKGEEVVVSYGAHSNDYLLVEYGFILDSNKHDCISVDHVVLSHIDEGRREVLERHNYFGDYYLTSNGFCYRTQVAIRAMVTSNKRMENFLAGRYDGVAENKKVKTKTRKICDALRAETEQMAQRCETAANGSPALQTIQKRWHQLKTMLDMAETNMFSS